MGQQVERLAEFVAGVTWESIPAAVQEQARLVFLDTLGVILVGSQHPEVASIRGRLLCEGGSGASVYARGFSTTDPRTAALLNGTAARSVELGEVHRFASGQAAIQALPAILATAEVLGGDGRTVSGRELLTALVVGHEVTGRFARAVTKRRLAHQNGQWPMLGAIAAAARLRSFDASRLSLAIRLGATLVLTPSYTNVVAGATVLNVAGGMSGFAGLLAPELALAGFVAQPDAIEEAFGELVGDGFDPENLNEELGQRWEITQIHFRLRACCNPIYSALDALEQALAELRPQPEEVERIDVETFAFASVMKNADPPNYFAAKYSLPHAAAAMIVRGETGYGGFTEEVVRDPRIADLRRRVRVTEDPALNEAVPRLKPARVTLALRDGRSTTRMVQSSRGGAEQPYSRDELVGKFRELAAAVLSERGVEEVESRVSRLDRTGFGELLETLRSNSR